MRALPRILCYHKVERRRELGVTRISPRRFAHQIERLARAGAQTLSLAELEAVLRGGRTLAPSELVITFDDAYRGLRDHAFPVLAAFGFRAICFAITDYAGTLNRWDVAYGGRRFAHLAWRDMRRWQERGIDFASHTATHRRLTWLDPSEVALEMARSRRALERALDVDTTAIAYPFGASETREREIARLEGYETGFSLTGRWTGDRMTIPRLPVYAWTSPTPGAGPLVPLEWSAAWLANRCAIGTTIWQRITGPPPVRAPRPETAAVGD